MAIRPDSVQFASTLPNYINIGNLTGNILLSGTIPNGNSQNFTVIIPTVSNNTRSDIYGTNLTNGNKQLLSSSNFISNDVNASTSGIYQHISTEFVQLLITNTGNSITVTITVNNFTGASITLVTQIIQIMVVEYQIPY